MMVGDRLVYLQAVALSEGRLQIAQTGPSPSDETCQTGRRCCGRPAVPLMGTSLGHSLSPPATTAPRCRQMCGYGAAVVPAAHRQLKLPNRTRLQSPALHHSATIANFTGVGGDPERWAGIAAR